MDAHIDQIKALAADGWGAYLPAYAALRSRHPGIRTTRPDECAAEAERRGLPCVNIYLAGDASVVCWPTLNAAAGNQS